MLKVSIQPMNLQNCDSVVFEHVKKPIPVSLDLLSGGEWRRHTWSFQHCHWQNQCPGSTMECRVYSQS